MALSREVDHRESILVRQGRGSFQMSCGGHEAVAALAPHIGKDDLVFPAYRDRALMFALGMTADELALDFFAREASSSGGRNLPGHYSCRRLNVFSVTSPVGAQCLPAVGAAWAFRLAASDGVAFCHIGDAATRQGEFFEAVAQAVQAKLPVVFVVEDNGYGISTPTAGTTPLALGMLPEGIVERVDGRDALGIYGRGAVAVERARQGHGPTVLWCDLDRLGNHTNADDHRTYRTAASIDAMADPVERLARAVEPAEWAAMRKEVAEEVRAAYERAAREPAPATAESHLYGPRRAVYPALDAPPSASIVRAVNGILRAGLEADPRTILFGQDIEDPKGGVFGLTKGLSSDFKARVVNSPLAEATIVGMAVGLAAVGWRPVFELQFVDFVGPAFNQLIGQASNLRWRTKGEWTCPLVLYAPCGAYLPGGGMWHSQSNEGWFAATPGLRVAVPSTPEDAAGLLWAAMHDEDPSLVLLPKHLLRAEVEQVEAQALAWGTGRVVRAGGDATVVAWGNCVEIALGAADRLLAEDGIRVEVIDPRTLVPCDWEMIADSLAKTGRLVVVQEDSRTCGFGQAIVAEMAVRPLASLAPPVLVSRPDVHVPFNAALEASVLPSVADVVRAVRISPRVEAALVAKEESEFLTVPQLGEGLRRVRVTGHLKKVGERVTMDEPLYEVETDKANVAVESSREGVLAEWCVPVGEEADVYGPIARIVGGGESVVASVEKREEYEEFPLSDRQRAMNRSALGGRLDVPLPASIRRPLSYGAVERARQGLRARYPRLRPTDFGILVYCAARTTVDSPKFRSSLVARGETVRRHAHVDIGFAIALPDDELATAVVHEADRLDFEAFYREMLAAHRSAKSGGPNADARTTLLVSSLAGHEVVDAAPVLFPPAIATLFLGAPHPGPTGKEIGMTLAFDHRLINGVGAARYLQGVERELAKLAEA